MAINKSFVVKNGLEVNESLIVADIDSQHVGIGSTIPASTLDVIGGIGATHINLSGVATVTQDLRVGGSGAVFSALGIGSVGVGTAVPSYLFDIRSPVSTGQTALYVQGDARITGDLNVDDIFFDEAVIGSLNVTGLSTFVGFSTFGDSVAISTNLYVGGISTFVGVGTFSDDLYVGGDLFISDNVILNTNLYIIGIATIANLDVLGLTTTKDFEVTGLTTLGGYVDINDSVDISDDLNVVGLTTLGGYVDINDSVDISNDLNVTGLTTFVGVGTFNSDLYVGGDLFISDDVTLDTNLYIVGIATIGSLDVLGLTTTRDLEVIGFTTLGGYVDINDSVDISDDLNVTGLSTFVGVGTFNNDLYVGGNFSVNGSISYIQATSTNLEVTGIATIGNVLDVNGDLDVDGRTELDITNIAETLNVAGISTFASDVDINASIDVDGHTELDNLNVSGVSTFVGVGTFQSDLYVDGNLNVTGDLVYDEVTGRNLNISGIATIGTSLDVNGDLDVDGHTELDNLNVSGIATIATVDINAGDIEVSNVDTTDLNVTGISTLGTVQISSGIITATTGIVTYYGDGSYLTGNARNLTATIGIGTSGGVVGYGVSFLDLRGAGVSTAFYNGNVGIATIFFEGGGGGGSASIGIGSTPGDAFVGVVTAGNLWYNTDLGRLFIYYQDVDSAQWVDAAPFNIGIVTSLITSLTLATQTASNPSLSFIGDTTTGLFSPGTGEQTFVSVGASVLNINPSGVSITGVATAQDFDALSDINFKENVTTVNNALLKVEQLRGVKFDWKESGTPSYGVIAQELEQVLPELVHGNDPKTVNYNGIIGVLIEAIKELKSEIEELKSNK